MKPFRPFVPVLAAACLALPAAAQDRSPAERQTLADLAFVLGQSHALRQACAGPRDQFWRGRMLDMLRAEAPDGAFERRLRDLFNTGYASSQAQFPVCGAESQAQAAAVARRGRALAEEAAR